jgi:hypothetical protein
MLTTGAAVGQSCGRDRLFIAKKLYFDHHPPIMSPFTLQDGYRHDIE